MPHGYVTVLEAFVCNPFCMDGMADAFEGGRHCDLNLWKFCLCRPIGCLLTFN